MLDKVDTTPEFNLDLDGYLYDGDSNDQSD